MNSVPSQRDWDDAERVIRTLPIDAKILLACHINPDGDALGSMLGFVLGLTKMGYTQLQASFAGPYDLPEPLNNLPGRQFLVTPDKVVPNPDLVLAFDAASIQRLGELDGLLLNAPMSIIFDHHASNTRFGVINLVEPSAAATSVVVDRLLSRLGIEYDQEIAECLYVALATDTGSFRFGCTPTVHELAARLLTTGIDACEISRRLFDSRPFGAIRLFGDVLARAVMEPAAAGGLGMVWTYVTVEDLQRHDQRPYVMEALIDSVRCAEEADIACLIKQVCDREWSVSLRSKGGVDVSAIAVSLGGGGHRAAAGFTGYGLIGDVIHAVRTKLSEA